MKRNVSAEKEAEFYQQMHEAVLYHQLLTRDAERNKPFYEALKRTVTPDSNVLDIGSGSGIWAITAAKLGARHVTAIEANTMMLPVIMAHAQENGVADRIKLVNGLSRDLDLKKKFDIVVSETIGNQAFDEQIISTMLDARERFLAPGGVMIPRTIALKARPVELLTETEMPAGVPVTLNYLRNLSFNISEKVSNRSSMKVLGKPATLLNVDMRTCEHEPNFASLRAEWELKDLSRANAVVLSAESELLDGINIDTWEATSWMLIACKFRPFQEKKGTLKFGLSVQSSLYHWSVSTDRNPTAQSYTPLFAYTKIKIGSQSAPRKARRRKTGDSA